MQINHEKYQICKEEKKNQRCKSYNFFIALIILIPKGIISIRQQHKKQQKKRRNNMSFLVRELGVSAMCLH